MLKALQLVFNLFLYFHLKACLWYFVCAEAKIWSPALDWIYFNTDNVPQETRLYSETLTTISQKYFISFYTSVIFVKGNEIGPRTTTEILLCSIILILDLIVAGNIFGRVAVLVQMSNRKSQKFQHQIDNANTSMRNMKIPKYLEVKIRDYLIYTQAT